MEDRRAPMNPDEAERRFADMLTVAGLPPFASTFHDPAIHELQLRWDHGFTIHLDLTRRDMSPIDDWEWAAILGQAPSRENAAPIHVFVAGSPDDPRTAASIPGDAAARQPTPARRPGTTSSTPASSTARIRRSRASQTF
jgi:hypothetical protein